MSDQETPKKKLTIIVGWQNANAAQELRNAMKKLGVGFKNGYFKVVVAVEGAAEHLDNVVKTVEEVVAHNTRKPKTRRSTPVKNLTIKSKKYE